MQFDVFVVDAETGGQLEGAAIDVYGPDGSLIATISRSETFGDCDTSRGSFEREVSWDDPAEAHEDNDFHGYELSPGTYRFSERRAPRSPQPRPERGRGWRGPLALLRPLLDKDYDRSEEEQAALDEETYFEYAVAPEATASLSDGETGKVVIAHERVRPAGRRRPRPNPPSRRSLLTALWASCVAGIAAICALVVAPAAWMTLFGVSSLSVPGMGIRFAAGNLADYLSSYLLDGWSAVGALSRAYSPSPIALAMAWAVAAGAFALLARLFDKWFKGRTAMRNELLDKLPPAAGHNECGSAELVRDPAAIRRSWDTCPEGAESVELGGIVVGCIEEPYWATAAGAAAHAASLAAWGLRSLAARAGGRPAPERPAYSAGSRRFVYSSKDENTMVIADTRAGKTRRCLMPSIDLLSRAERESIVAVDPKGELYGLTSEGVSRRCERVVVYNFRDPLHSHRYNFMQAVVDAMQSEDGPDWEEADKAASDLVEQLLPKTLDVGQSTYFNQGARAYIKSAVLWTASWKTVPDDQRNLTTASRMIGKYGTARPLDPSKPAGEKYVPWAVMLDKLPRNHPAREAYEPVAEVVEKERMAFVTTAQTTLRDFRDSNISAMTSATDFNPRRIGLEKCAVYVIIPIEKQTYGMFATLMLQQFYQALATEGSRRGGRLPYRVNFLCEEFGQFPPIPDLDQKMNSTLALGIRWTLILQSIAQLSLKYDRDAANAIIPACETKMLIKTTDHDETGRWFSDHIGDYTIAIEGASVSGARLSPVKESASSSVRLAGRRRLFPAEVCMWRAAWGSLVTHGASEGSAFVIPLPDVSELSTTAALGLGDPEHNRLKMERALAECGGTSVKQGQPYYPELKQMRERKRPYTDEELRAAEAAWFRDLRAQFVRMRAEASGKAPARRAMPTERENRYGVLVSPDRSKSTKPAPLGEAFESLRENLPGWTPIERITKDDAMRAAAELKARKRASSRGGEPAGGDGRASI